jgi:hypothetical protein
MLKIILYRALNLSNQPFNVLKFLIPSSLLTCSGVFMEGVLGFPSPRRISRPQIFKFQLICNFLILKNLI